MQRQWRTALYKGNQWLANSLLPVHLSFLPGCLLGHSFLQSQQMLQHAAT